MPASNTETRLAILEREVRRLQALLAKRPPGHRVWCILDEDLDPATDAKDGETRASATVYWLNGDRDLVSSSNTITLVCRYTEIQKTVSGTLLRAEWLDAYGEWAPYAPDCGATTISP